MLSKRYIPVAALVWVCVAAILFLAGQYEFSLNERQTRPRITLTDLNPDDLDSLQLEASGQFFYGDAGADMLPNGEGENYANREAGLAGSELARMIFESNNNISALSMSQTQSGEDDESVTIGTFNISLTEVANRERALSDVSSAINRYFPRTSLAPKLWLMSIASHPDTVFRISPINTGVALGWFVLAFASLEAIIGYWLRATDDKLIQPLLRVVGVFLLTWSLFGHMPLWDFILNILFPSSSQLFHPSSTVVGFTSQHLELVIVSSFVIIPLGILIGISVTRENFRDLLPLANSLVNSGQTVPTLAVVAIMAPIIGFGFFPAIIALILYGLLPVVRNTITGLNGVDYSIIDSAKGMGMTATQILIQIEIPIASRIIMAGVRTAMVINVGTATLGAFVGSGGLGVPITSGLSTTTYALVFLGALPAALLAILIDYILGRIEYVMTPKGLQIES